jgi:hypothetical protein
MSEKYTGYINNQNTVFDNFRATTSEVGKSAGIERDPGVDPQGAFLIAWRFPEKTTQLVNEFSQEVMKATPAIHYGPENAHVTLSDHNLRRGQDVIIASAHNPEDEATLDTLTAAVKTALENTGKQLVSGCAVTFEEMLTNRKMIIAAGTPTESIWQLNQEVLAASQDLGIDLKGTWGAHMTTSRFTEDRPPEEVGKLMQVVHDAPSLGLVVPSSLDVGYFHTDPQNGFVFTPYERFELGKT